LGPSNFGGSEASAVNSGNLISSFQFLKIHTETWAKNKHNTPTDTSTASHPQRGNANIQTSSSAVTLFHSCPLLDFGEDRVRRGRPHERVRVGVGSLHILIDFLDQFFDVAKRPATNGLVRNPIKPDLHLIQPRGIGRGEVHVKSWPCGEPAFTRGCLCVA
jgi:hypothetical protein